MSSAILPWATPFASTASVSQPSPFRPRRVRRSCRSIPTATGRRTPLLRSTGSFPGSFQATPSATDGPAFTDLTYRAPVIEIVGTKRADRLIGSDADERIDGKDGADRLDGNGGDDTLLGGNGDDRIDAGCGADSIDGGAGHDQIVAGLGDDSVDGGNGDDRIEAGDGDDTLLGGLGKDTLDGGGGDDRLEAGDGNDIIYGRFGDDTLLGGNGADTLYGGVGRDMLIGGAGKDVFAYEEIGQSSAGMDRDVIVGFDGAGRAAGDCIDLRSIDANISRCGDQAFKFIGLNDFSGIAQVRITHVGGDTLIQANVDASLTADFEILVTGVDPYLTPSPAPTSCSR